jgi:TonB-linked SusC/RagA family outer membrane protein
MKYFLKLGLGLIVSVLFSPSSSAQKSIVRGQVTDENKVPLAAVTITVAGKNTSAFTTAQGEFSIEADSRDKLKFSYVGMDNKTVDINNRLFLNVVLKLKVENSDEVVVIGYETVRRSDVTGSISTIKGSDLRKQAIPNIVSAMVGKVPGAYIRTTGNEPGGANSIKIRGLSSINGTGEPLYVVDGIYIDNINFLNPSDVKSIEILKDAASTSIYGSRGANGVVLITTTKPKAGQVLTTFSSYYTTKEMARKIDVVDAAQYATLFYEMKKNRPDIILPTVEIVGFPQNNQSAWGNGYNMVKESRQPWTLQNHDLNINYGKAESSLGLGINFLKDNGAIKNQDYTRFNMKINGMIKPTEKVELGFAVFPTRFMYNHMDDGQKAVETIFGITPVTPIYTQDGKYNSANMFGIAKTFENPIARLSYSTDIDKTDQILSDIYANVTIIPKLIFRASVKYNYSIRERLFYLPSTTREGSLTNGKANVSHLKIQDYTNNYILSYAMNKNKQSITMLGGMEISEKGRSSANSGDVTQFNSDIYGPYNLAAGAVSTGYGSFKSKETLAGFLGRVNYKYDDKYFITLTSRYDGSSKFGSNNKWAFFPGIAIAWDMNKEKFLSDSKVISNWKWRISAGQSGSSSILPYQSQGSIYNMGLIRSTPTYAFGNTVVSAEAPETFSNPNLKWEITTQYNAGVEIGLWGNRVNFVGDVFIKKISDLLVKDFPLPGVSGFASSTRNGGDMTNTGIEFSLNGDIIKGKKFKLSSNIVFSKYKNEIIKWLGQGSMINENKYTGYVGEGYAYGVFWEVPQLGIFSSQDEINNYLFRNPSTGALSMLQPTAKPGDIKYADTNGDGVINLSDRKVIGSPHPDFTLGMGFDMMYKNWNLNIFVNSVIGKEVYNSSNEQLMNTWLFNTNKYDEPYGEATSFSTRILNRWTPDNIYTSVPKLGSTATNGLSANLTNVENGSFIRFENISLSYSFPQKKKKAIKNLSIFGSVQNAFLITKYGGTDPENNQPEPGGWATNQSSSILAYDNFGYPRPITYTFGLNVNF